MLPTLKERLAPLVSNLDKIDNHKGLKQRNIEKPAAIKNNFANYYSFLPNPVLISYVYKLIPDDNDAPIHDQV